MYIYGKPFIFPIHYIFIPGNNKIDACHFQDSLILLYVSLPYKLAKHINKEGLSV